MRRPRESETADFGRHGYTRAELRQMASDHWEAERIRAENVANIEAARNAAREAGTLDEFNAECRRKVVGAHARRRGPV